jgi:hypothetical protein
VPVMNCRLAPKANKKAKAKRNTFGRGLGRGVGQGELFFDDFLAGLHEFGFGFDAQPSGVVKQLVNALVGDLPVEKFAHAGLRLSEDRLEVLL